MIKLDKPLLWPNFTLLVVGVCIMLLGGNGLSAWYTQGFTGDLWFAEFPPFYDGAALGFLCSGIACISAALAYKRVTFFFAFLIILICILSALQILVPFSPVLYRLVSLLTTGSLQTGSMSLAIVFPMTLVGFSLFQIPRVLNQEQKNSQVGFLAVVICILGVGCLFGDNSQSSHFYNWEYVNYNAATSALGFIFLGAGIGICSLRKYFIRKQIPARFLPILVGALVIIITLMLWQALLLQKNNTIHRMIKIQALSVKNIVNAALESRFFALDRMAGRWEIRGGTPKKEWEYDAEAHVRHSPGYQALEWVDNSYHVRWVVPLLGNEKILNINTKFEDTRASTINLAAMAHKLTISPSIDLLQGGRGFLVYVPLYVQSRFDGMLVAAVKYNSLFTAILNMNIAPGYNISVYENAKKLFQRGEDKKNIEAQWGEHLPLDLNNVKWEIEVWPTQPLLAIERSALPTATLLMGIMMALLLGLSIRLAQLAQKRARAIESVNQDLQREISERERAEQQKLRLEKALLQNQKIQAIGTLAGGIAHDFNNILYSIMGYVGMAKDDMDATTQTHKNLVKVLDVAKRGQELVSQILSFSRQQQYIFKAVSLRFVIESTLSLLYPTVPAGVNIVTHLHEGDDTVWGNHTQLQQVIVNIINNAIAAMNEVGQIELSLSFILANEDFKKHFPSLTRAAYFCIKITDTGTGMDNATMERIFEPFFTTKEVNKGTGLGMSIAHGIIRDHDGEIIVQSQLGVGSTFTIYLPLYEQKL